MGFRKVRFRVAVEYITKRANESISYTLVHYSVLLGFKGSHRRYLSVARARRNDGATVAGRQRCAGASLDRDAETRQYGSIQAHFAFPCPPLSLSRWAGASASDEDARRNGRAVARDDGSAPPNGRALISAGAWLGAVCPWSRAAKYLQAVAHPMWLLRLLLLLDHVPRGRRRVRCRFGS
jgi:hypothetical protein